MNLQRIERLKGLLARVELNAKQSRGLPFTDVMVTPLAAEVRVPTAAAPAEVAPIEPVDHVSVVSATTSVSSVLPLEELELEELAAALPPTEPERKSAVAAAKLSEPPRSLEIEDVSAEDISFEEVETPVPAEAHAEAVSASIPPVADVGAAPMPYTSPPSLSSISFSEPPPPEEEAPVSARQSIEQPLTALGVPEAEEAELPLLTPPPESGRQPSRAVEPLSLRPSPTVEQLGDVVELEEAMGPDLELAEPPKSEVKVEPEELEFVPSRPAATEAREAQPTLVELEPLAAQPLPVAGVQLEPAAPVVAMSALTAEVIARAPVTSTRPVIDVVAQAQGFAPKSFLELLDASLKLGKR